MQAGKQPLWAASRLSLKISVPVLCLILAALVMARPFNRSFAFGPAAVVTVNAASYSSPLAPGSIAAAFGTNLATRTELATNQPLPTNLAGTVVKLTDSNNAEYLAPLFFVSAGQINYLVPEQIATGNVKITVTSGSGEISAGDIQIAKASPAIFTFFSDGRGVPVGLSTWDGISFESVVNNDGSARMIEVGSVWQPKYLVLFGTGLRYASNLKVRIGGVDVEPMYAGPQNSFAGLDQINLKLPTNTLGGVVDLTVNTEGRLSNTVQLRFSGEAAVAAPGDLTVTDVQTIIAQAVTKAQQVGLRVNVAVTDHEGNVLGVFKMTGARSDVRLGALKDFFGRSKPARGVTGGDALEGQQLPLTGANAIKEAAALAAISKAGTAAFFSTQGNSFTTRTASFIVQEHLPPGVDFTPGGPLFGVQFSQLPCSDIKRPNLPFGLSGDPGGVPIYKNGVAAGGVGIEGDGFYGVDLDPADKDIPVEELIAVAATQGYEAPADIRGDQILVDAIRLPFVNAPQTGSQAAAFNTLPGTVLTAELGLPGIRATPASAFTPLTLGGIPGRVDARFFPFKDSTQTGATKLTAADVTTILTQGAQQAYRTRAAIRRPLGSPAEVNLSVVDTNGVVLGLFSTIDAPIFGFDVCVQKARTAAFFSNSAAGAQLRAAGFGRYVDAASADGVGLDGNIAFSARGFGFLNRPFFPDGIQPGPQGPFSKPIAEWSPFNVGLQIDLDTTALVNILNGTPNPNPGGACTAIPSLANGIQIFAGAVPLYKNGVLVGAIGISGDGIDQDDIIASAGSVGFEAPERIRSDQIFVRGVRLPFVKFPRHPNL